MSARHARRRSFARSLGAPLVVGSVLASTSLGCGMDLPLAERIINVRPLAMRVEVVDPFAGEDEAIRTEALPVETITVRPFIVDEIEPLSPERIDTEIEPMWLACPLSPLQGIFACLLDQVPLSLDEIEECPPVDFAALESGDLPAIPTPCRITGGTPSQPQMQIPLDFNFFLGGDLELTMIGHRPGESSTERCAESLLSGDGVPAECIVAVQRASIGPDGEILRLAADAGIPEDQLGPIPDADQVPDADRHPRIQTFRAALTDQTELRGEEIAEILESNETIAIERGDTITVAAGQTLVLETIAPEDDLQEFVIPTDDSQFEPDQEQYEGAWYRTWGTLLSSSSDDPRSLNTWAMVPGEQDDVLEDLPPEGRATMYYVLRDGRQGVDWWWFHVQVEPAP